MTFNGDVAAYIERLPVGVYRSTRGGRLLMANPALAAILGFDSIDELLQARTTDFYVDPQDRVQAIEQVDKGEDLGVVEHWLRRRDGTRFLARIRMATVRDSDGRAEYLEGVIEDITEAHRAREQLALSEARFRTAFEQSPFPMILMTPDIEGIAVNAAATDMLQISEEEFLTLPRPALMTDDDLDQAKTQIAELHSGERDTYSAKRKLELPNNETKWVMVTVSAIRRPDGSLHSLINQIVDITDQQKVQEQLEALVDSKQDLIRSVSHELRTPLTSVVGLASELSSEWERFSEDERRELTDLISSQSLDMAELVDDLLASARSEVGPLSIDPIGLDLAREVASVAQTWDEQGILNKVEPDEPVLSYADPYRVRQILRNLITNAVKYGASPITLEVRKVGDTGEVSVRDMGEGIPEWQHQMIFDPYFRAHSSDAPPGSIGLGLAVSRDLARLMGGDLRYQVTGGTSEFVLSLPLSPTEHPATSAQESVGSRYP